MQSPFLRDMPFVAIVRNRREVNGEVVKTPKKDCRRVFFRVENSRVKPDLTEDGEEVFPNKKSKPDKFGFEDKKKY